jgi:hypothetical protein
MMRTSLPMYLDIGRQLVEIRLELRSDLQPQYYRRKGLIEIENEMS